MSDIVERLRSEARILARDDGETLLFAMQCGIMREAASDIAALREENEQLRKKLFCPIGLDETPTLCSAGYCKTCLGARMKWAFEDNAQLRKELDEAKAFIADTYGDEEKPRYTTRRMRMEIERAREMAMEDAARIAATEGVHPLVNVYDGGPEWYRHGIRIAAAIRRMKESKP